MLLGESGRSLVGRPGQEQTSRRLWTQPIVWVVVSICYALSCYHIASIAKNKTAQAVQLRHVERQKKEEADGICRDMCGNRTNAHKEKFNGSLLNRNDLLRIAQNAKEKLVERLKVDYGEHFEKIFVGPGKTFSPISDGGPSTERLKRKLIIKVLETQVEILRQENNLLNSCDCSEGGRALTNHVNSSLAKEILRIPDRFGKYVWATGGHSAAAGHGNLFNESYTAYMSHDAQMVFEAIGIDFEARNYAMGGTKSGSEISMCWEQIFGSDVDFFSWDYGMTDGKYAHRLMHFGYRGGRSPGRPALMGMKLGDFDNNVRISTFQLLEDLGMAVFYGSANSYSLRNEGIPDSAGISRQEIEALPTYVRNFRCGEQIENGDPYCQTEKYSQDVCSPRAKQVSWHPGFKSHALDGHALALFLVDTLIAALSDLRNNTNPDPYGLLEELREKDTELYNHFVNANLSQSTLSSIWTLENDESPANSSVDFNALWKGSSLCRTARLPAQSRYLGYTTNTDRVGGITSLGNETYDVGTPIKNAISVDTDSPENGSMMLSYFTDGEREPCDVPLKPDYKDFFFAHHAHGWRNLIIPNDKERVAYNYSAENFKGMLVLFFVTCDWGRCEKGEVRPEDHAEGKFKVTVNGDAVETLLHLEAEAWALQGEGGSLYWNASQSGNFDIGVWVNEQHGFVRISSIVIY